MPRAPNRPTPVRVAAHDNGRGLRKESQSCKNDNVGHVTWNIFSWGLGEPSSTCLACGVTSYTGCMFDLIPWCCSGSLFTGKAFCRGVHVESCMTQTLHSGGKRKTYQPTMNGLQP